MSSTRSRLEGDHRLIGRRGVATYGFRVLSGMDVQVQITAGGNGQVRLRAADRGLAVQPVRGGVRTYTLTVRTPYQPAIQTLQVRVEAGRRGRVVLYGITVRATQRDEDGDGIGDSTERLLGAPASALKPKLAPPRVEAPATILTESVVNRLVPLSGEYRADPFSIVYLRCALLTGMLSGRAEPVPLTIDPMLELLQRDLRTHQRVLFSTLVATLMVPSVRPIIDLEQLDAPPDYAALVWSAAQAVDAMAEREAGTLDAGLEGIGVLASGWESADTAAVLAVALPLVRAGVPVQFWTPQRLVSRPDWGNLRLLIWTPEAVPIENMAALDSIANWVRSGGWLFVVGMPARDSQGVDSPTTLQALLARLGLNVSLAAMPDSGESPAWQEIARHGTQPEQGTLNRRWVDIDLSPYAGQTVYVRFSDSLPDTGFGACVRQVRLEADGRVLTAFQVGTSVEQLFLYAHSESLLNANGERVADGSAWFVYRFPLPAATRLTLQVEIAQEWRIELSLQPPYLERVLTRQRPDLPMLTLRHDERVVACSLQNAEVLYQLNDSPVGVLHMVGRGGVVLLGVSSGAFANSPNGESQLRQLVRYIIGRAGVRYRERARFTLQRGDWLAAFGTYRLTVLRGTYLDVLDPMLPIQTDVVLEPRTPRLLLRVDTRLQRANLLHTNAQMVLRHETVRSLSYLMRGAEGVPGFARISLGSLKGQVQLLDPLGRPAPVKVERAGRTVLIRWNMSASGHVLIVR